MISFYRKYYAEQKETWVLKDNKIANSHVGLYFNGIDRFIFCTFEYIFDLYFIKEYVSDLSIIFDINKEFYALILKNINYLKTSEIYKGNCFYLSKSDFHELVEQNVFAEEQI